MVIAVDPIAIEIGHLTFDPNIRYLKFDFWHSPLKHDIWHWIFDMDTASDLIDIET